MNYFLALTGHSFERPGWGRRGTRKINKKNSTQRIRYLLHLELSSGVLLEVGWGHVLD
jgi:hypothetical protein